MLVVALVAVVVTSDVLVFREHLWERLVANGGLVRVFGTFGLRCLRRPSGGRSGGADLLRHPRRHRRSARGSPSGVDSHTWGSRRTMSATVRAGRPRTRATSSVTLPAKPSFAVV